ncbi:MAG TPA: TlpA disulfide reductase family protein, partial [Verrucomicrobiae bacterium]|nr:TlpA disulfide reductase family protein [Verrucomicrobiae bacterium]
AAVNEILRGFGAREQLPAELESITLAGALDPDMDVRETSLQILQNRNHPMLASLAAALLRDPDPQVRILGLDHLTHVGANVGVPVVIPVLEDDDPLIVVKGLKLLERWGAGPFGVMLRETTPIENEKTGLQDFPDGSREKAKAGAALALEWWTDHRAQFPLVPLEIPRAVRAARKPVAAGDFTLRALDGRRVRLADFRGKIVLINFWTTWCPACVSEMPDLIALQKRHLDQLVIIGVSLDFVPDEHGHIGGYPAVEEQGRSEPHHADADRSRDALAKVCEKVARAVKARNINYPILLDEQNEIGGRFNGGELPTTVIIDAHGNVRRRFIGARSLEVFAAMVEEAAKPASDLP